MSGYGVRSSAGPAVRLVRPGGAHPPISRASARNPARKSASKAKAWIVRSIMMATTLFAFLDLLLLASGGHH